MVDTRQFRQNMVLEATLAQVVPSHVQMTDMLYVQVTFDKLHLE